MPKKLRIIVAVLVLALVSGFIYLMVSGGSDMTETGTTTKPQTAPTAVQESQQTSKAGKYADYSEAAVADAEGRRILFFHAPWCPQCRQLEESIVAGDIPPNTTIFKVDYDSSQKLRQQYGVTIQTTLVLLDDNGNEAKKYIAYGQPSLDAIVKNLL